MQKSLKSNERRRTWVHRTSKIEIQKGRPNNSDILQIWLPLEIRSPLFNLQKFQDSEKSTPDSERNHWKLLNNEEFGSIELLRLKYRTGSGPNNSDIPQNWLPLEIRSPLFNLQKFLDPEKSIPDSCTNDWNLMNDEVFGSIELLRLKYRRGGEHIIETFCKFVSIQKLGPPSFISRNFRTLTKVVLIHTEITEI